MNGQRQEIPIFILLWILSESKGKLISLLVKGFILWIALTIQYSQIKGNPGILVDW
jgi:hypothetical protein